MSVKKVFQDAASCATIQLEDTSVLAWQDTHFWEMAVIVLVSELGSEVTGSILACCLQFT